jgi:hypothetical protein
MFTAIFLILGVFAIVFKPIYSVTLNGKHIGYCKDKVKLQNRISTYMEKGDESNKNLAFVSIDNMPTYKMCLLKRGLTTNDDEIFNTIIKDGVAYYKYYAIVENDDEKLYVSDFEKAEKIIKKLKNKDSNNISDLSIIEKYDTKLKKFTDVDTAVAKLYERKPIVRVARSYSSSGSVATGRNLSSSKINLGISLARPLSGRISSRFGSVSRVRSGAHTGLDISAPYGTRIKAAASGKVAFAGYKGAYGNMIAIDHGHGVMTYYAHCSSLKVSVGTYVSQGSIIAAVGSTGNSTGNHLHLEVRVNGIAYNPQNYLY